MPTAVEVEARLRAAATACEPLVEELLGAPPDPSLRVVDHRPRRTGRLAAAALVVVAAVGVAVAVVRDEPPPGDEVRAAPSTTRLDRPPTTDPRAANPALSSRIVLPDGSDAVVSVPGPRRWAPRWSEVVVAIDGVAEPVTVTLSRLDRAASPPGVEQQLSARAALATWGDRRYLVVDVDGWMASLHLASDGGDLPDDRAAAVGEDLTFRVTPDGPMDVGGPGITPTEVSVVLTHEDDPHGKQTSLMLTASGGEVPGCGPDGAPSPTAGSRCLDDLLVAARGSLATAVLPGITAVRNTGTAPLATQVPVSLADGTEVVLALRPGGGWAVTDAVAWVDIDGVESGIGPIHVMLHAETALQTAARDGSTLEVLENGLYRSTAPSGSVRLMVEGGGWNASLPLDNPAQPVPDGVRAGLERSLALEATDAGPGELRAAGLEVVEVLTIVSATDPPVDRTTGAVDGFYVTRYQEDDGEVRVDPAGPRAGAAFPTLTFEVSPPR